MIKILIADDQDILKQGLSMILGNMEDIKVCGLASNGNEAYKLCKKKKPDVVLMDIKMPALNGVEATKIIKEDFENIKIIVLTTFNDDEYIYEALKNGASGYLLKDASPEKIADAIRTVHNGGALIQSDVAVKVIDKFSKLACESKSKEKDKRVKTLTKRELEICRLLAQGKNNKEIAQALFISKGTVKNHITKILTKLELRDRTQLAIFSVKNDIT
ncbi:MAG: response regulator transcription factor [Firmicutes bacterium]|nr:response regulator transcription factor [Bacillota bacterium]